jgi:glycerophosphoryl diester phosphodiesterase
VAHRGASDDVAEHTLAAYERALADGADGVECDVRLTRDGVLVCVHDRRIDRTSSGRGLVSALDLAYLADLDFGDRAGVLTLDRLLELVADCGRRIDVAIETKHPSRYAGLVERTLAEVLAKHGLSPADPDGRVQARVMSFAVSSLRRMRELAPSVPTVALTTRLPMAPRGALLPAGAFAAGPSLRLLRTSPSFVDRVHAAGGEVHVWTVNGADDVAYVADLGVDVIITNRPRAVREQLESRAG